MTPRCVAGEIAVFVRKLAQEIGGSQHGTVGRIELLPISSTWSRNAR